MPNTVRSDLAMGHCSVCQLVEQFGRVAVIREITDEKWQRAYPLPALKAAIALGLTKEADFVANFIRHDRECNKAERAAAEEYLASKK